MSETMTRPEAGPPGSAKKYVVMVVPETHWDREWYKTFQQFRWQLVKLTDKLLNILDNDPEYKYFTFDGQTVVLEDYLEIRPGERERIAKHVKSGRLLIGPWYVLPDEFLVSGEAIVRNFLVGQVISESYDRSMKVGYIPDPFGHLAQMPQILQGFGLDNVMLMRGIGGVPEEEDTEFYWEGLDGSKVLLIHQLNAYCNASGLGLSDWFTGKGKTDFDKAVETIRFQTEDLGKRAKTPYVLLNNGCDHVEPQTDLAQILQYAREKLPDYDIVHATYEQYIERLKAAIEAGTERPLGLVKGELHGARHHPILSGVWSTRIYLKQWNNRVQNLLEKYAEPTSAFAALLGRPYDREYLHFAWKELLKNHPHDSICGCSADQVHEEMLTRFAESEQVGELITDANLQHVTKFISTARPSEKTAETEKEYRSLVVFNPHGWTMSGPATLKVRMNAPKQWKPTGVEIRDGQGKRLPCQMSNEALAEYQDRINPERRTWTFDLVFEAENVPACGYKTFYAEWSDGSNPVTQMLETSPTEMENMWLRVEANANGTIDLTDKRTGVTYSRCLLLEDSGDGGDEYDYGTIPNPLTLTNLGTQATIGLAENGPVRATLRIEYDFMLPESLTENRCRRSDTLVPCRVVHEVSLGPSSTQVDVRTTFTNRAKDHRLRMRATAPIAVPDHVAETVYGVIKRPNMPPRVEKCIQKPLPTYSQRMWAAVDDGQVGLAVSNVGLPEYQVVDTMHGVDIALTLLRAVGWLSRDDYPERPYNVGPKVPTPRAQCLDTYVFEYSLEPYIGRWDQAGVWKRAHALNSPMRVVETDPHEGDLPATASLFSTGNDGLALSAVKMAERENKLLARFYNTTPEPITAKIRTALRAQTPTIVDLNELPISGVELRVDGQKIVVTVEPYRILTLAYDPAL